jgi:transposase-like protein
MDDLDGVFFSLRAKILTERDKKKFRVRFSPELKAAVVDVVSRVGSHSICSKRLGLAESILYRWCKSQRDLRVLPPRRLVVTSMEKKAVSVAERKSCDQTFEAILANGIVLKGLVLTAESLQMLDAVR